MKWWSRIPLHLDLVIQAVTFLGWLSDPFKGLSDLQLGDEKVTLNHLGISLCQLHVIVPFFWWEVFCAQKPFLRACKKMMVANPPVFFQWRLFPGEIQPCKQAETSMGVSSDISQSFSASPVNCKTNPSPWFLICSFTKALVSKTIVLTKVQNTSNRKKTSSPWNLAVFRHSCN